MHDPDEVAPANSYATKGGLTAAEVRRIVHAATSRIPVVSATLASYDPRCDRESRMQRAALDLVDALARRTRRQSSRASASTSTSTSGSNR